MAVSLIGVSSTRSQPKRSSNPAVTLNAPPYTPTSSPSKTTAGSRSISSNSAWRMASSMVTAATVIFSPCCAPASLPLSPCARSAVPDAGGRLQRSARSSGSRPLPAPRVSRKRRNLLLPRPPQRSTSAAPALLSAAANPARSCDTPHNTRPARRAPAGARASFQQTRDPLAAHARSARQFRLWFGRPTVCSRSGAFRSGPGGRAPSSIQTSPWHILSGVVLSVALHAHGLGFDENGALARAASLDSFFRDLVNRYDVIAVNDVAGDAVSLGAVGQVLGRHLAPYRRRVGPLVVLDDADQGSLLHRRQVDALMKRSGGGAAVADPRHRDNLLAQVAAGHGDAGHYRDQVAQHGDGR